MNRKRNLLLAFFLFAQLAVVGVSVTALAQAVPVPAEVAVDAGALEVAAIATADAGSTAPIPDVTSDPGGFLGELYSGVRSGNWLIVGALLLSALTLIARKVLGPTVPWFKTDTGGVVLVFGTSLILGLANALWVHAPIDLKFLGAVLMTAVTAAGGYSAVKRVLGSLVVWAIGKVKGS